MQPSTIQVSHIWLGKKETCLAKCPQVSLASASRLPVWQSRGTCCLRRVIPFVMLVVAEVLAVAVRTIKRDFAYLHEQGHFLPSRGYRQGIGRGQSHKVQIIEQWLSHATYDQIMERTRHSLNAIRRYIQSFVRIVELDQQEMSPDSNPLCSPFR